MAHSLFLSRQDFNTVCDSLSNTRGPSSSHCSDGYKHAQRRQTSREAFYLYVYTVRLQIGAVFLNPKMMHGAVNKPSGMVLEKQNQMGENNSQKNIFTMKY